MSNEAWGAPGRFTADQLQEADRCELSRGHKIYCAPAKPDHGGGNLTGALPVASDPLVKEAGIDVGYSTDAMTLRAPDIAVGNVPEGVSVRGWTGGAPPLAIEYAGVGNDENNLLTKIAELFAAGTQFVWVVRLLGERRVEVFRNGESTHEVFRVGQNLLAPGILKNPVPVLAMFDRTAAFEVTLINLLQRVGYESLDHVRDEGIEKGIEKGIEQGIERGIEQGIEQGRDETREELRAMLLLTLDSRGFSLSSEQSSLVSQQKDLRTLRGWFTRALRAISVEEVFRDG